uniref:Uncharacterized protein n=1 Tax=Chloroflexus aurantiacus TaxID=1108 RepID=Q9F6X2_CHLAU|nr:unknown [Chloroflexus aurantiacus]
MHHSGCNSRGEALSGVPPAGRRRCIDWFSMLFSSALRLAPTLIRPRWGRELWVQDSFCCRKLVQGCDMPSGTDTTGWERAPLARSQLAAVRVPGFQRGAPEACAPSLQQCACPASRGGRRRRVLPDRRRARARLPEERTGGAHSQLAGERVPGFQKGAPEARAPILQASACPASRGVRRRRALPACSSARARLPEGCAGGARSQIAGERVPGFQRGAPEARAPRSQASAYPASRGVRRRRALPDRRRARARLPEGCAGGARFQLAGERMSGFQRGEAEACAQRCNTRIKSGCIAGMTPADESRRGTACRAPTVWRPPAYDAPVVHLNDAPC